MNYSIKDRLLEAFQPLCAGFALGLCLSQFSIDAKQNERIRALEAQIAELSAKRAETP